MTKDRVKIRKTDGDFDNECEHGNAENKYVCSEKHNVNVVENPS